MFHFEWTWGKEFDGEHLWSGFVHKVMAASDKRYYEQSLRKAGSEKILWKVQEWGKENRYFLPIHLVLEWSGCIVCITYENDVQNVTAPHQRSDSIRSCIYLMLISMRGGMYMLVMLNCQDGCCVWENKWWYWFGILVLPNSSYCMWPKFPQRCFMLASCCFLVTVRACLLQSKNSKPNSKFQMNSHRFVRTKRMRSSRSNTSSSYIAYFNSVSKTRCDTCEWKQWKWRPKWTCRKSVILWHESATPVNVSERRLLTVVRTTDWVSLLCVVLS